MATTWTAIRRFSAFGTSLTEVYLFVIVKEPHEYAESSGKIYANRFTREKEVVGVIPKVRVSNITLASEEADVEEQSRGNEIYTG